MCSRAERKRRRKAERSRADAPGEWVTYSAGRGQGMTRSAVDAFRAAVASHAGPFTFPPDVQIAFLDLAVATGNTVAEIERAAREVVDRLSASTRIAPVLSIPFDLTGERDPRPASEIVCASVAARLKEPA